MKTTNRKFFYGDKVEVRGLGETHFPLHVGHTGYVTSTLIRRYYPSNPYFIMYTVACYCGATLSSATASHISLVERLNLPADEWGYDAMTKQVKAYITASRALYLLTNTLGYERDSGAQYLALPNVNMETTTAFAWRLWALLDELSPQNKDIMVRRFGLNGGDSETFEKIGFSYNLSKQRIQARQVASLKKMRRRMDETRALVASKDEGGTYGFLQ